MEVTRQFRKEKLNQKGQAPIQLTFCWDGLRLRFSSGEKCHKDHWNDKAEKVKDKPGAYADQVNGVLDNYAAAAESAYKDASYLNQRLTEPQMEAEIRRRYALLATGKTTDASDDVPALPSLEPEPPGLLDYMQQWIDEQHQMVSLRTGQKFSRSYLLSLSNTRTILSEFATAKQMPLSLASMDRAFYTAFRNWFLGELGQGLNTFGKHIKHLRACLDWCVEQDLPVSAKYRRFDAPDVYVGADALTQAELLSLAALDFSTPAVHEFVQRSFEDLFKVPAGPRKPGVRLSQADPLRVAERIRMLERSRDKLLQCCYFGLRISTANEMTPQHVQGELVRIVAGKNRVLCLIPYFDDDVFKPVQLVEKYAGLRLGTCLPTVFNLHEYLPFVQQLAGITRIPLTSKVGRKTFATLKIYQGVPKAQVMLATGHKTEKNFNRYLGIDEEELIHNFRKTARRVA